MDKRKTDASVEVNSCGKQGVSLKVCPARGRSSGSELTSLEVSGACYMKHRVGGVVSLIRDGTGGMEFSRC